MHKVVDTPWNTTDVVDQLKLGGVETVIRYYNQSNSSRLPEKRIKKSEAQALADAGLNLAVVFQQRGGANGHISDLDQAHGRRDAARALQLADEIDQPEGSAIYFAVDHDYFRESEIDRIKPYFEAAAEALDGRYKVGVYGSGRVGKAMKDAGFLDYVWLAGATGWSGTREMLQTDQWALFQKALHLSNPLPHDGNVISPAWPEYGQFQPGGSALRDLAADGIAPAPLSAIAEVTARSGLKLRRGPSKEFAIEDVLPRGTLVHVLDRQGAWLQVDLQGDGVPDGFMHGDFLRVVSGGLPIVPSPAESSVAGLAGPYAIAEAELALGVAEVPGPGNNPRIVLYHNSTRPWSGTNDSVPWCSSFVNYCVEQAGHVGTDSQAALSWEEWGDDVTDDPSEGDIVVWERVGQGGHVGFFVADHGNSISVLGGNQSNRVRISSYPKNGTFAGMTYKLRGIRRG